MIEQIEDISQYDRVLKSDSELRNYANRLYKSNGSLYQVVEFDRVSDLVECCDTNKDNGSWDNKGYSFSDTDKKWTYGTVFKNQQETREALLSGSVPLSMLSKVDEFKSKLRDNDEIMDLENSASRMKRKRVFSESEGDLNIDKYMSGDIEMWERMTRRPQKQSVKVVLNNCRNASFDASSFTENMITLSAFLDILESAGISTEIYYGPMGSNQTKDLDFTAVLAKIKSAEEPLDISQMIACGAPGLFRYYTFRVWCNILHGRPDWGLGRMVTNTKELENLKHMTNADILLNADIQGPDLIKVMIKEVKNLLNLGDGE